MSAPAMTPYQLRKAVKALIVDSGLMSGGQVIIRRRTNIWNDIATAIESQRDGQCLVIGTAKGDPLRNPGDKSNVARMDLTIPVSLVETPRTDPEEDEEEDLLWQRILAVLQGETLGRSDTGNWALRFDGFDDAEAKGYVIRQTIFKTEHIVSKRNTPVPAPPEPPEP